jgi:heme/copper-type cytochrome/quinol oxidase subunit 4
MSGGPLTLGGTDHCLLFILGVSMPLSIIFVVMLQSGYSLRPNLTSIACGLASAAAAATLLNFIHVHDETASDLAIHAFAVSTVILANRIFGVRFLVAKTFGARRNKNADQLELTSTKSFKPTSRTPHDWTNNVKDGAPENWPASTEPARANHQGHVIRFHRPGFDGS